MTILTIFVTTLLHIEGQMFMVLKNLPPCEEHD